MLGLPISKMHVGSNIVSWHLGSNFGDYSGKRFGGGLPKLRREGSSLCSKSGTYSTLYINPKKKEVDCLQHGACVEAHYGGLWPSRLGPF